MKPYNYIYIYTGNLNVPVNEYKKKNGWQLDVIIRIVINLWKHVKNLISLMSTPTEVLNYLKLLKDKLQGK